MGYQLPELQRSQEKTQEFLNMLLEDARQFLDVDTANGVQNFVAAMLPDESVYLSISCADCNEEIDKNLDNVKDAIEKMNELTDEDNLSKIKNLKGKEKTEAYTNFMNELKNLFIGTEVPVEPVEVKLEETAAASQEEEQRLPLQFQTKFPDLNHVIEFCHTYGKSDGVQSQLIKKDGEYYLWADFNKEVSEKEIITFVALIEEFEGVINYGEGFTEFLREHGEMLLREDAMKHLMTV